MREICAYEVLPSNGMPITPAPVQRDWMDQTDERFAYRCLPLVMANQAGWLIGCPTSFTVRWNGGRVRSDLRIRFRGGPRDPRVLSHFGHGVLTFSIPYLFRTPPAVNLWVKGPSNWLKDGIQPLEGIVESDWLAATFTMNWRMTRPNWPVRFERGEPICMIVPLPRDLAEDLEPRQRPLTKRSRLNALYRSWMRSRGRFISGLRDRVPAALDRGWQKDYFVGRDPRGRLFDKHQTRLHLKEFARG